MPGANPFAKLDTEIKKFDHIFDVLNNTIDNVKSW